MRSFIREGEQKIIMIGFSAAYFCFYIFKITPVGACNKYSLLAMSQNAETGQRLMPASATKIATLFVALLIASRAAIVSFRYSDYYYC